MRWAVPMAFGSTRTAPADAPHGVAQVLDQTARGALQLSADAPVTHTPPAEHINTGSPRPVTAVSTV